MRMTPRELHHYGFFGNEPGFPQLSPKSALRLVSTLLLQLDCKHHVVDHSYEPDDYYLEVWPTDRDAIMRKFCPLLGDRAFFVLSRNSGQSNALSYSLVMRALDENPNLNTICFFTCIFGEELLVFKDKESAMLFKLSIPEEQ